MYQTQKQLYIDGNFSREANSLARFVSNIIFVGFVYQQAEKENQKTIELMVVQKRTKWVASFPHNPTFIIKNTQIFFAHYSRPRWPWIFCSAVIAMVPQLTFVLLVYSSYQVLKKLLSFTFLMHKSCISQINKVIIIHEPVKTFVQF